GSNRCGRITAVDAGSGGVRWQYSVDGVLGAPAAAGGMVFVPWDRQNLAIIDGMTGHEIARLRSTDDVWEFVFAAREGVFYGSHGVYRLTEAGYRGVKTGVPRYEPPLRDLPSQAQLHPDGFSAPLPGRNARDKVGFQWAVAAEQPPDSVGIADDTIYLLHYRFVFAFEAQSGHLRWAYRHPNDIESMRAVPGGAFFVEGAGQVTFLG